MITASHNPPEYNGVKPIANDGVELSRETSQWWNRFLKINRLLVQAH